MPLRPGVVATFSPRVALIDEGGGSGPAGLTTSPVLNQQSPSRKALRTNFFSRQPGRVAVERLQPADPAKQQAGFTVGYLTHRPLASRSGSVSSLHSKGKWHRRYLAVPAR